MSRDEKRKTLTTNNKFDSIISEMKKNETNLSLSFLNNLLNNLNEQMQSSIDSISRLSKKTGAREQITTQPGSDESLEHHRSSDYRRFWGR